MKERIAKLIDVKSLVTLLMTSVFCILTLKGIVSGEQFITVFTVVISFYFGVQTAKKSGGDGEMEKAKGIDVSHWQGRIDFEKVKSQGYSFVMINAGYGKYISQKDENFEKNYAAARKAGLNIGTYWYSYALTEAGMRLRKRKLFLKRSKARSLNIPSPLISRTLPKVNFQTLP